MIEFFVHGTPIAQGRPRAFRRGSMIGFYDPKESKGWKAEVAKSVGIIAPFPSGMPLKLSVRFYLEKPKSVKRLHPTVKPDLDNYVKAVMDALKDVWGDDCQVVQITASKEYSLTPGAWVVIKEYKL
jgi:Holliday junction resolvase RusA-like endonuclease